MPDLGLEVLLQGNSLLRLLGGLWVTIRISLLSVALSLFLGVFLGMAMTLKYRIVRILTRIYLEFIRIMPQLVLLFLAFFGLTRVTGINLSGEAAAIIVFTFWGTAEMGDLVRGALISIPRHQYDSGYALGLRKTQVYRRGIIPQTLRRLIPPAINLTTRMIKTTSLVVLIGVVEVVKIGQQIIEAGRFDYPTAALGIYILIFFMYFIICYPVSKCASLLEKRWAS